MDTDKIKENLDKLSDMMTSAGLTPSEVGCSLRSHCETYVYLTWGDDFTKREFKSFIGNNLEDTFKEVHTYIKNLPSREELKKQAFLNTVSNAIQLGKEAGVDVDLYIAPLREMIKKLSGNIIKYQV